MIDNTKPLPTPVPSKKARITVENGGVVIETPDGSRIILHPSAVRLMAPRLPEAAHVAEISAVSDVGPQSWKSEYTQ